MYFDTHCHLYDEQFKDDVEQVIKRARDGGVLNMLVLGDKIETSKNCIEMANDYEGVFAAVGVFPCECYDLDIDKTIKELKEMVNKNEKIKAIGEIGLDYYWEKDINKRKKQKEFFIAQLKLADEVSLPVAIHARDSIEDVYRLLKENYPKKGAIMHCFSSSVEMMKKFVELGCYISLGGPVTFKNAITPKEVAKQIPLDRLIIETDSPYLAPHPFRGKRNEPIYVKNVLAELSVLINKTTLELEEIVFNNSCKILGVKK